MGFISRSLGIQALSMEDPSQPLMPYDALYESLGLGRSDSGILINEKMAMRLATAYSCVKIVSEDLGRLSLEIYQQMPDASMRLATEHRLYDVLHTRPNPNMSSMTWRGAMIANVLINGNAYSWIKRDKASRVIALVPLDAAKTSPVMRNGELMYATTQTDTGHVTYIESMNVLHFMGLSIDGITGISPISNCKNTFGLGLAAEKYGNQFFGNGARATGVFSHPQHLDTEAYENIKKSLREVATGDNALRPIVLEEGMSFTPLSLKNDECQFMETYRWSKEQVASLYRVPMHLLQDLTRSTNANIEHQSRDYAQYCLSPIAVKFEQEINFKLLGGAYFCEHNFREMERSDFASQTTGLLALRNGGIYSANDVLKALRENPIPEDQGGDIRIVQGAFIPLDSLLLEDGKPAVPETAGTNTDESPSNFRKTQILASYRPLFRDAVGRSINRNNDQDFIKKAFQPAVASMCQALLAMNFGQSELSKDDLIRVATIVNTVSTGSDTWNKSDASEIATRVTAVVFDTLAQELLHETP
jgi:HK97 family phage portal protein